MNPAAGRWASRVSEVIPEIVISITSTKLPTNVDKSGSKLFFITYDKQIKIYVMSKSFFYLKFYK